MDLGSFLSALITGTPIAILLGIVGVVWQALYSRSRDRQQAAQGKRQLDLERERSNAQKDLEKARFEYQKQLETLKFEYQQRQWREELGREMMLRTVEVRIEDYAAVWSQLAGIAKHPLDAGALTIESAHAIAVALKGWRYGRGGLLAAETTRDAAFALQTALWDYDGTTEAFKNVRFARRLFRQALRADIGLGEDYTGQTIFEQSEKVQKIQKEIEKLQSKLGIPASDPG